jgi:organic hydroperoxide reductase OsmC/OhrA
VHPFPHHYRVHSTALPDGPVLLNSDNLAPLPTTTPPEFDGPSGWWSPETLLVGAVVDCYALTFRGLSRKMRVAWTSMQVECLGMLERPDQATRFTRFDLRVRLNLAPESDEAQARRALERAEETCLITRSMNAETHLHLEIAREADVAVSPV